MTVVGDSNNIMVYTNSLYYYIFRRNTDAAATIIIYNLHAITL